MADTADTEMEVDKNQTVLCRFMSEAGEVTGSLLDLPLNITRDKLQLICNALLQQEENLPYIFLVKEREITGSLENALEKDSLNTEEVIDIIYQQQAVFRVRPVTRCTSSMPGHAEAVISVRFSPNGRHLASGSGDTTVRLWDISTQTPHFTCTGHRHWVLCIAWAPDSSRLASACKNGHIMIWDAETGKQVGRTLSGHKQWVTSLSWEPYHRNPACRLLASSSKDGDIRIWDTTLGNTVRILTGHTKSVSCVIWGGAGLIYSASQDRTVKVWRAEDGVLCRTLDGHAHWVNTLALNCDYTLRIGPCNPVTNPEGTGSDKAALQQEAEKCYQNVVREAGERLVSGSDDFTLFLWHPEKEKKPVARMTGHQQLINCVQFSPDARYVASASFDKSIKLWDGRTGKFIATFRGHVQAVYMVGWSPDSRLLVSGSRDSTLKVWSMKTHKIELDLPGHADEVFAVDWAPDGMKVASGGKDKVLKLWSRIP